jgi:2-polyprenyl-6-methoxyphenol hydroxylase-like FAD-dependent oxidoreductase
MKINVVGGGPGGLYFALLMKKHDPACRIVVYEQNPQDATYGWGIVLSDRALSFLHRADRHSFADLSAALEIWHDQILILRGERVAVHGSTFSGMQRLAMLQILQKQCADAGVELHFESRVTDLRPLLDCDLLVGADGVNSTVRGAFEERFQPALEKRSNFYAWYGTHQLFDGLSLIFRDSPAGPFVGHAYRYSRTESTFVAECQASTFRAAGLAGLSEDESRRFCEQVFREDLGGHALLSNKSAWGNYTRVSCRHWHYRNVALLGDALRTVHFSIGSGTRTALEDAIALRNACAAHQVVKTALAAFERARRPAAEQLQGVAYRSILWYEQFGEKMRLPPIVFAYDYMVRGGRLDEEIIRRRDPQFVAAYERYRASQHQQGKP